MGYFILTNNKMVKSNGESIIEKYRASHIEFLDNAFIHDVLVAARNYVHKGHKILTHPLSGSVKPGETPFKSICITVEKGQVDINSLMIIEDAIILAKNFSDFNNGYIDKGERILNDFRVIDYDLILSGLESAKNF